MRIVGGKYKSRVLCEVKSDGIRPTADKVRESLFNILQNNIYGTRFLDLFCGTGAMGIEALSRGAGFAAFNDADRNSLNLLKKNLEKLKVSEDYKIYNLDAAAFLSRGEKFDIIYIDPPYKSSLAEKVLPLLSGALSENGVAIFEDEKPFDGDILGLKVIDRRKYGRVHLTFFKKGE
ncbi:MAG: 16S rRNA (guanine(966)-N(2))-methyltransferase RsmD [Clostridia bacterium]|nr:16S rRNA (guanine(966)-N(2))-methyltransferase RsmD [Clostridia bacterium]